MAVVETVMLSHMDKYYLCHSDPILNKAEHLTVLARNWRESLSDTGPHNRVAGKLIVQLGSKSLLNNP